MKKALLTFVALFVAICCMAQGAETSQGGNPAGVVAFKPTVKTVDASVSGGEAIMKEIIRQNENQVLLVDFWATWCRPCRMAMEQIDEIKPALTKKGCVFVYITGETSPLDKWNKMIVDSKIEGVHYRLTNKQWGELCQALGIRGIPTYMVINKNGSVAYDNIKTGGYPGSEVLQNEVEVALTNQSGVTPKK